MARIDVTRKQKTAWPWVLGVIALVLATWGITVLLTPGEDEDTQVTVPTVEDTLPPSAIPTPPEAIGSADAAPDLAEIMPVDDDDLGQPVRAQGTVVATGSNGFWLLVDGNVVRVDSDRTVRRGQSITARGSLETGDPERAARIGSEVLERQEGSGDWNVLGDFKIVEPPEPTTDDAEPVSPTEPAEPVEPTGAAVTGAGE